MSWWEWALVAVAGGTGAPIRYVVDTLISTRRDATFPFGTLAVNVSGSLALGLITGLVMYHGLPKAPKVILGTGLVGAYTTFSTFGYETLQLAQETESASALLNVATSFAAGTLAAAAGLALGSL